MENLSSEMCDQVRLQLVFSAPEAAQSLQKLLCVDLVISVNLYCITIL